MKFSNIEIYNMYNFIKDNRQSIIPIDIKNLNLEYYEYAKEIKRYLPDLKIIKREEEEILKDFIISIIEDNKDSLNITPLKTNYISKDTFMATPSYNLLTQITAEDIIPVYSTSDSYLNEYDYSILNKLSNFKSFKDLQEICNDNGLMFDKYVTSETQLDNIDLFDTKVSLVVLNSKNYDSQDYWLEREGVSPLHIRII